MKSIQENKLSMYYAVQKVCKAKNSVWKNLPAFVSTFADFETHIGKIERALETQVKNITGVSKDKNSIKDAMIEKTLQVSGAVFAYASDINDLTLKGKVDFSRSDLNQVRDSITTQSCQVVYTEASAIVSLLGNFGITTSDLGELKAKIDAFAVLLASPRTAITERKGATNEIGKLLVKTDGILKNKMDKLMEKFKPSSPEFYRLFFNARIIVNIGVRHEDNDENSIEKPAA